MPIQPMTRACLLAVVLFCLAPATHAQGTQADYQRAAQLNQRFRVPVTQLAVQPRWIGQGERFWFKSDRGFGQGGWVVVDAATGKQEKAFDIAALAAKLAEATGESIDALRLPLNRLRVADDGKSFRFVAFDKRWVYTIDSNELSEADEDEPREEQAAPRRDRRWRGTGRTSPDGQWTARIVDHNLVVSKQGEDDAVTLTTDGTAGNGYTNLFYWSPDSTRLVAIKRQAGGDRRVTIIDSMPDRDLQPRTDSYFYLKPGDKVAIDRPHLFDLESMRAIPVSHDLADNPYRTSGIRWKPDSSALTYEHNPRGHQGYRVIEVDAKTGESRALIDETPQTFFTYSSKKFLHYLDAADELIWMSERDGWNHLYLYDGKTGEVKRQITKGDWVVRKVDRVDEEGRVVWFWACGIHPGQDPYHEHYCRADLDTGAVTALTKSDGTHTAVSVAPDGKTLVATWSRIDHPPVHELRSAETGELIKEIARADASSLIDAGWVAPERFVAKGRDGETDIWGIIIKPTNFDPSKKYPVIENIYAGPHGAHVPKKFYPVMRTMQLAELGFIVVRIDGMGTNWRSKAFHDVAWKNLKDAGFPDRIAWMESAAQTRPWMDLSNVGIYGGSAGGQNAMRAVLDHHDFYKAAAADCGCHDNRMDKIWWNEQWMGWPVDQSYIASSNTEDAHKLGGALLLTVGELDRNVDPASTMQVVDALIQAGKDFELMVFPGKGHGAGESAYGQRLRADFFVRELHGVEPRGQ